MSKPKVALMIDSGAYSAYTMGVPINIDKYAKFVIDNKQHIYRPINLDIVGHSNPEEAAAVGYKNYHILKDKGVENILPVYHQYEKLKWLNLMLEEAGEDDIIGLSSSMTSNVEAVSWYNILFNYLTDNDGYPIAKFHAFGDSTQISTLNFPWFSNDSSTWAQGGGRAGRTIIKGRTYQLGAKTRRVDRETLEENDKSLEKELISIGVDPVKLFDKSQKHYSRKLTMVRMYMFIRHFLELEKKCPLTYKGGAKLLVGNKVAKYAAGWLGDKAREEWQASRPCKMFFGVTGSPAVFLPSLVMAGVENILISFFYITPTSWNMILEFLYDPLKTVSEHKKVRDYWEQLNSVMLVPGEIQSMEKKVVV